MFESANNMITLLTTLVSFLAGGLPKILDFFQDRQDKAHELNLAQMQTERELALMAQGFANQARIEEIRTDQVAMETSAATIQAALAHDAKIGENASQWVTDLRSSVRPIVTYIFVLELVIINIVAMSWAVNTGVDFAVALSLVFSDDEMTIVSSIVAFWFGTQAFAKKR
jgi:hypothetical protein